MKTIFSPRLVESAGGKPKDGKGQTVFLEKKKKKNKNNKTKEIHVRSGPSQFKLVSLFKGQLRFILRGTKPHLLVWGKSDSGNLKKEEKKRKKK